MSATIVSAQMVKNKSLTNQTVTGNRNGFSLLEVLIVVVVITILSVYAPKIYTDLIQKTSLESESSKFAEALLLAKKKAESIEKACINYGGSYIVEWNTSSYRVTPKDCSALQNYTLPSSITIDAAGSSEFYPLGKGNQSECIVMTEAKSDKCKMITLTSTGVVDIGDECNCP